MRHPFTRISLPDGTTLDCYSHTNDGRGTEQYAIRRRSFKGEAPRYLVTSINPHDKGRKGVK